MDFELLVVRGRSGSEALKLADGVTTVGRQDECQIRIKSSQVSRRHCELFEKKGMLLVKDLGSSNGTFVNGKKIQGQQVLEPGDELMIGQVTLRVAKVGEAPPIKEGSSPGPSAADTAVVQALPVADSDDVEFEIAFDDEPVLPDAPEKKKSGSSSKVPAPKPAAAESKATKTPKATPTPAPAAEPDMADEAIADFLLDIKLDDEE